jgi:hypothetical protein
MEVSQSLKSECTSAFVEGACERTLIASFMLSASPLSAAAATSSRAGSPDFSASNASCVRERESVCVCACENVCVYARV